MSEPVTDNAQAQEPETLPDETLDAGDSGNPDASNAVHEFTVIYKQKPTPDSESYHQNTIEGVSAGEAHSFIDSCLS